MNAAAVPSVLSVLFCAGLAFFVFLRNPKSFVHRTFALGMLSVGLMEAGNAMTLVAVSSSEQVFWKKIGFAGEALLPGSWLLFSLSFARSNYKGVLYRWWTLIFLFFAFPIFIVSFSWKHLLIVPEESYGLTTPAVFLGRPGYYLELFLLLGLILVLTNLEATFRASSGTKRWQIKFMILGLGSLFAFLLYLKSRNLLFSSVNFEMIPFNSAAVLVADSLILFSIGRRSLQEVDLYISKRFLFNSLTLLVVGIYLIAVGSAAKFIDFFGRGDSIPLGTFVMFLAVLGVTVVLLSDQLREETKRFISRNFYRAHYDYRKEWTEFTERTSQVLQTENLCAAVTRMVSETLGAPSVTIWLLDETRSELSPGGSTALSQTQMQEIHLSDMGGKAFLDHLKEKRAPVVFRSMPGRKVPKVKEKKPAFFETDRARIFVPLLTGQQLLGIMVLERRSADRDFTTEDLDLLNTLASQAAGSLLNLRLSQQLLKAKEAEAFQTLSTFFIHDLKNLASMLSLTMQNLPANYDNPVFRKDTLRVISESVSKMNAMCNQLSVLTRKLDLKQTETDLNELVAATLADLNGCVRVSMVQDLQSVPKLVVDPDQIQKVLVNLVLNANEAVDHRGEIRVATGQREGWAVLSVTDNGCGMSKEFVTRSLFQPFQTTKSRGLGIGLFHSKKIIEAHDGRIEVETETGRGSSFRVMLPLGAKGNNDQG